MDARTASSGSSVWEGQLQSLVLSEYASTEMSLHALYMHQVSGQLRNRFQPFSASAFSQKSFIGGAGVKMGFLCVTALAILELSL